MRISSLSLALVLAFTAGCPGDEGGTDTMATTAGTAMTAGTMTAGTMTAGSTGTDGTTTQDPTTGGGGAGGYCARSCAAPADCCFEGVPDCPGAYPNNWTCDGGVCGAPQCANDDECTFGGVLPNNKCLDFNGYKACLGTCMSDADCMAPLTCSGTDDGGTNKFCFTDTAGGCMSDDDCMGNGKCNTATGACECSADADCTGQGGDKCVM